MKKKLTLPILAIVTALFGLYGVSQIYAQNNGTTHTILIQRLAQKFNLNEADVATVFAEVRSEHHAQMQKNISERLDQLAAEGKITAEQKTVIATKFTEIQAEKDNERQNNQNLSLEERKAKIRERHDELNQWVINNGLDLNTIFPYGKFRGHGHMFNY